MQETVESAVELFCRTCPAETGGIDLSATRSRFRMPLRDPIRLRQALLNLIGNALKFTAKGEINVRVFALTETNQTVTFDSR